MDLIRANAIERLVVIALMDLNGLKAVNDRHGHKMADWLLVSFANNLRTILRQQDKAYRYRGMSLGSCCRSAMNPITKLFASALPWVKKCSRLWDLLKWARQWNFPVSPRRREESQRCCNWATNACIPKNADANRSSSIR